MVSVLGWFRAGAARIFILNRLGLGAALLFLVVSIAWLIDYLPGPSEDPTTSQQTYAVLNNISKRLDPGAISNAIGARVADWKLYFPIIREHWALGVGAGNSPSALKRELIPDQLGSFFVPVHNVFLLMLSDLGVLGGAAWALIMVAPLVWLLSSRRGRGIDASALLWLGPLVVILFVSMLEFSPWATQDARLLMPAILGLWAGGVVEHAPSG